MVNRNPKNQNSLNLFMNNYSNAIIAGILILFLMAAYFIFLLPKFQATQAAIKMNIEEQQLIYENQQRKLANLMALAELYKKINPADLAKFNSVLPDSYPRERLFGELEEIVSQGGWIISSIEIEQPEEVDGAPVAVENVANPALGKKVGSVNLEMSVKAIDYTGLKNLLKILESNLRLLDVSKVSFVPMENTATIVLTTYFYQSPN
ncbi:MAG: hypothetical protein WC146_02640 [Patescibacteria group bacterium]|jgi:hypothetical protein